MSLLQIFAKHLRCKSSRQVFEANLNFPARPVRRIPFCLILRDFLPSPSVLFIPLKECVAPRNEGRQKCNRCDRLSAVPITAMHEWASGRCIQKER